MCMATVRGEEPAASPVLSRYDGHTITIERHGRRHLRVVHGRVLAETDRRESDEGCPVRYYKSRSTLGP